jgi:hypothetical protein
MVRARTGWQIARDRQFDRTRELEGALTEASVPFKRFGRSGMMVGPSQPDEGPSRFLVLFADHGDYFGQGVVYASVSRSRLKDPLELERYRVPDAPTAVVRATSFLSSQGFGPTADGK